MRESREETGLMLRNNVVSAGEAPHSTCFATVACLQQGLQLKSIAAQGGVALSKTLQVPTPFAAADVISKDRNNKIEYHYTIVEVQHMHCSILAKHTCIALMLLCCLQLLAACCQHVTKCCYRLQQCLQTQLLMHKQQAMLMTFNGFLFQGCGSIKV